LPRLCGFPTPDTRSHGQVSCAILSSPFALLQSLAQRILATGRSRALLSWACVPYSTRRTGRSTSRGCCLPASFRPQGLATLSTVSSRPARADSVSHRRRSWASPSERSPHARYPRRFRRDEPTYRCSPRFHRSPKRAGRPEEPRFLGFYPRESPWRSAMGLARLPLDAPLGFPFQGIKQGPPPGFRPTSSHALRAPDHEDRDRGHLRVSPNPCPVTTSRSQP
jgi:hypothetical protein